MDIDKFLKESKESIKEDSSKPWRSKPVQGGMLKKSAMPKKVKLPAVGASDAWGQAGKMADRNKKIANKVGGWSRQKTY